MYANSFENARNRVLILMFAIMFASSLGWNVKQLFDVSNYKKLYNETTELLNYAMVQPMAALGHTVLNPFMPQPTQIDSTTAKTVVTKEVSKTELQCLAENIYHEANNQGTVGMVAVGNVTLNRVGKPGYPKTVCGVVNHKINDTCMFSWKCAPPQPIHNQFAWKRSQEVALDLLSKDRKDTIDITEGATHFHNQTVKPNWKMKRIARIGDHTFYKQ